MNMKIHRAALAVLSMTLPLAAHAIDHAYARKLDRSGCTQVSELQGCDINKTKAENAKAGFGPSSPPAAAAVSAYSGEWLATSTEGQTVAAISVDDSERVKVDGKTVSAKRSDGALVFKAGTITYTLQGDPRLTNENRWFDSDARTTGPIRHK